MDKDKNVETLLAVIEHPENYTESDIEELLSDSKTAEYYSFIVKAKQALTANKTDEGINMPDIDKEWKEFERRRNKTGANLWRKAIAACIAVLLVSGVSFATIRIVKRTIEKNNAEQKEMQSTDTRDSITTGTANDVIQTDSISSEMIVFDNEELQNITRYLEKKFGMNIIYKSETAKHIRLFLQLSPEGDIDEAISLLNHFEDISVSRAGNDISVE